MTDENKITQLTNRFFNLFTNTKNRIPNVNDLRSFFLPNGIIINNTGDEPAVYNLDSFIKPRIELLTNGTLLNFSEKEVSSQTEIHGNIARRICHYKKSGELNGKYFEGKGLKLMQFIKVKNDWKLSSVVWTDEK
jgi:hypothetical protein